MRFSRRQKSLASFAFAEIDRTFRSVESGDYNDYKGGIMVKRMFFGLIWSVAFYFMACVVTGAIAGGMAGSKNPSNAVAAGAEAGRRSVEPLIPYFLIGSITLSAVCTIAGVLPGTRPEPTYNDW